jgi:hypothetical protein
MPALLYNLELTEEELSGLWAFLSFMEALDKLDTTEQAVLEKLQRLMEGK